jgi:biopolymer transport protein ExbD
MKIHKTSTPLTTQEVRSNIPTRNRVVDALIINTPDLSFYVRLQNLINFLLERINSEISRENNSDQVKQIDNCLNHIEMFLKNDSVSINKELSQILEGLLEEGRQYQNILQTFSRSNISQDTPFEVLIAGKATQIQWLGVCIIEEIKKLFRKS